MKTRLIILSVLAVFSVVATAQTKTETKQESTTEQEFFWQVNVSFDLNNLDPQAIQIGFMDNDPISEFSKNLDLPNIATELNKAKDDEEKDMLVNAHTRIVWDRLFRVVNGYELYLLTKSGFVFTQSGTCTQPKTKKWIVSKVFYLDDKVCAYAVPLDVENGSKLEVTLNKTNLISLTDLYDKLSK